MTTKERYKIYLKSDEWKALREKALVYADRKCQVCNTVNQLVVHHRTYPKVLGEESLNDLTVLCNSCHHLFHRKSSLRNKNGNEKKKLTRKEKRAAKKAKVEKPVEIKPKTRSKKQQYILDQKIKRREEDLKRKE